MSDKNKFVEFVTVMAIFFGICTVLTVIKNLVTPHEDALDPYLVLEGGSQEEDDRKTSSM